MNEGNMIWNKNKQLTSGGMNINSILMKKDLPIGVSKQSGGTNSIDSLLGDFVVPTGLIVLQNVLNDKIKKPSGIKINDNIADESIFDQILNLDDRNKNKKNKKTKKNIKKKLKKTRKFLS